MLGDQLIGNNDKKIEIIHKAIRLCEEVGVDLIKVPISFFQNDKQNIANDVSIPIIVAGGDYMGSDDDVLKSTELIMKKGARGVAMGRNIFQRENPVDLLEKIHKLIHGKV
jgi:DhnA family fructose-bisphosphate aldolase class Ia